jgi:ergothioneine biosynthesis protein EgtB
MHLQSTRQQTLALLDAYAVALGPTLRLPFGAGCNLPLWEAGHLAWFQAYWLGRNRQRKLGVLCDPIHARPACRLPNADALYDSSAVPHASRWALPLLSLDATLDYMAAVLDDSLALLAAADNDALYFFRLVLLHEAMHNEAAVYMAQALGITLPVAWPEALKPAAPQCAHIAVAGGRFEMGATEVDSQGANGFAFDNELQAHSIEVTDFEIDADVVTWRQYLPFVEASNTGTAPRYLRRARASPSGWECQRFGQWIPLKLDDPAVHLSYFEAQAWCAWAQRRLPIEAEWEYVARSHVNFRWGRVWEWTASAFAPYPGFTPHPYRDYSAPWFDGRPVLRGACWATSPHMVDVRYRNFFTPERTDIYAGFRSCALR